MVHSYSALALFLLFPLTAFCQKVHNISGKYSYRPPEIISIEQAKAIAVERARIDALSQEFGSNILQTNTLSISAQNGDSETNFYSLGMTEVNGDWLSDTKSPEITIAYEQGMLVISAQVWGKARERKRADYELSIRTLCNGIESDVFKDQDRFSVLLRSAVNVFTSIWLADDNLQQVYCLLPYENENGNAREIKRGNEYTLLSTKDPLYPYREETILTTDKESEFNRLVFIFSSNEFTMPLTERGEYLPELSLDEFEKWLQRNRIQDERMSVKQKIIEIRKQL